MSWQSGVATGVAWLLARSVTATGTAAGTQGLTYGARRTPRRWNITADLPPALLGLVLAFVCTAPAVALLRRQHAWTSVSPHVTAALVIVSLVALFAGAKHLHEGAHRRQAERDGAVPTVNPMSMRCPRLAPGSVAVNGLGLLAYERFVLAPVGTAVLLGGAACVCAVASGVPALTFMASALAAAAFGCAAGLQWDLLVVAELRRQVPLSAGLVTVVSDNGRGASWCPGKPVPPPPRRRRLGR